MIKQLVYNPRDQPFHLLIIDIMALHGMRFTRTGLPIRHNSPIEAIKDIPEHRLPDTLVHLFLGAIAIEDGIEHERDFIGAIGVFDYELLS